MTTALYHAEVRLGLGHTATIDIVESDPESAPDSGADWPVERDWPRATLTISLTGEYVATELRCDHHILGEKLHGTWGSAHTYHRFRIHTVRTEYLADAVAELRALAEAQLAPVIAHVAARAARLQLREERLAAGRRGRAVVAHEALPIEVDQGALAADEPASDDSAQRFALIELDGAAPAT